MPAVPPEVVMQIVLTAVVGAIVTRVAARLESWRSETRGWRESLDRRLDLINEATQATMRADLIHLAEKYITRGWLTSEEYNAWLDMHAKYAALGANGLIDSYHKRLDALDMREI